MHLPRTPLLDTIAINLAAANSLAEIQRIVRTGARRLAGSQGATLVLREGDMCFYADEDAISPLWKGQRFPVAHCISGWSMLHHDTAVIEDITVDPRIPQEAYQPTFVRSLAMTPIQIEDPVGAIGVYWARRHRASAGQVADLEVLAAAAAQALKPYLPVSRPA